MVIYEYNGEGFQYMKSLQKQEGKLFNWSLSNARLVFPAGRPNNTFLTVFFFLFISSNLNQRGATVFSLNTKKTSFDLSKFTHISFERLGGAMV